MRLNRMQRRRRWSLLAPLVIVGFVGACSSSASLAPSTAPSAMASTAPSAVASTAPSAVASTAVTLVVQDGEAGSTERIGTYTLLDQKFEQQHPGVTIQHISEPFANLTATLNLQLSSSSVPDMTQVNQGYQSMGILVKGGLLLPLDSYATKYGWAARQPATLLDASKFSPDGTQFGTGNLYGISATGDLVGIYYNKATLQKLGLQLPTTLAQFTDDLAVAKQAGVTPIAFGDLDKSPGIHDFQAIVNVLAPVKYQNDFVYGRGGVSFDTPKVTQAATTLQDWANKGYFTPGFLGLGYSDWVNGFQGGKGLFIITGSWYNTQLLGAMGSNVGFFLLPGATAGEAPVATGAGGLPWTIPKRAKNPDLAAAYIDFITSSDAAALFVQRQDNPMTSPPAGTAPQGSSTADILAAWAQLRQTDGFVPFMDWATPTLYNTLSAGIEQLMGNKITPSTFVQQGQADYAKFVTSSPH
jgi:raffinose/stachyose/melibiose transport system substrate-binding protein